MFNNDGSQPLYKTLRICNKLSLNAWSKAFCLAKEHKNKLFNNRLILLKTFKPWLPLLIGFFRRILMNALAKCATHGLGQEDGGVAILIAQAVRSGKRAGPFLFLLAFQQVHLLRPVLKV